MTSCRNRHCPKCQGKNREEWIAKEKVNFCLFRIFMWCLLFPIC
ncbi:MAG: transposase zinc-binding domain-containing protein [Bacteroidetes bacterium]|nr:transposase zinc-binding domain-containing protein [Bacteroidota bacterium]